MQAVPEKLTRLETSPLLPLKKTSPETPRPRLKIVGAQQTGVEVADLSRSSASIWGWRATATLLLLGCGAFFIDLQVSDLLNRRHALQKIHRTLELAEPFGDAAGVILVAAVIAVLDPLRRRAIPSLLLISFSAGLLADGVKISVGRLRPNGAELQHLTNVWQTFLGWFPGLHAGWGNQSFPSAHTTVAWGLAMALVRLYPRGKWLFPILAGLVALQRVETGSHYLSDVLFGAAIGVGVAALWFRNPLIQGSLQPLKHSN
ncbi:MAG: phosphatase PAP2 family protein [Planctomycetales bacterium]